MPFSSSRPWTTEEETDGIDVASILNTIPTRTWDAAADSLLETGVATIRLVSNHDDPSPLPAIHARSFRTFQQFLDRALDSSVENENEATARARARARAREDGHEGAGDGTDDTTTTTTPRCRSSLLTPIAPQADSAHVSGFHPAGGTLSRYNHQREGIIFSDAACASLSSGFCGATETKNANNDAGGTTTPPQSYDLSAMFESLHGIAEHVLCALERKLELVVVPPATRDTNQVHEDDAANNVSSSLAADSVFASNGDQPKQTAPKNTRGWFQRNLGPTATASQWHMKRFVERTAVKEVPGPVETHPNDVGVLLPMHTDPSLISVVIHDNSGQQQDTDAYSDYDNDGDGNCNGRDSSNTTTSKPNNEFCGARGLQYYHPPEKKWKEVEAHGHAVATIFVGSVLAYLTCGKYPAAKHRVIEDENSRERQQEQQQQPEDDDSMQRHQQQRRGRMAATLFVRPQPSAVLTVPLPSPWLLRQLEKEDQQVLPKEGEDDSRTSKKLHPKAFVRKQSSPPITFEAWLKRVAKNYEKQTKKKKSKTLKQGG